MVKPSKDFNASEKRAELRTNLNKIKGVQEVRLDNDWMEKLTALCRQREGITTGQILEHFRRYALQQSP